MLVCLHLQILLLMLCKVVSNVKEQDHSQTDCIDIEILRSDQLSSHIHDVIQYIILTREILILNLLICIDIVISSAPTIVAKSVKISTDQFFDQKN